MSNPTTTRDRVLNPAMKEAEMTHANPDVARAFMTLTRGAQDLSFFGHTLELLADPATEKVLIDLSLRPKIETEERAADMARLRDAAQTLLDKLIEIGWLEGEATG